MKRLWAISVVLLAVALVNGCSKCSREEVPAPPPGPPPAEDSAMPNMPTDEMEQPGDQDQDQNVPEEDSSPGDESTD
jgi:hypothetical protein